MACAMLDRRRLRRSRDGTNVEGSQMREASSFFEHGRTWHRSYTLSKALSVSCEVSSDPFEICVTILQERLDSFRHCCYPATHC